VAEGVGDTAGGGSGLVVPRSSLDGTSSTRVGPCALPPSHICLILLFDITTPVPWRAWLCKRTSKKPSRPLTVGFQTNSRQEKDLIKSSGEIKATHVVAERPPNLWEYCEISSRIHFVGLRDL
jgi:hypothetical protein